MMPANIFSLQEHRLRETARESVAGEACVNQLGKESS